jgi:hypothetical protein
LHHHARVSSEQLTLEQLRQLQAILRRYLRFLNRLLRRMEQLGFAGDDPLYRQAYRAQAELQSLGMEVHYLACQGGVGKSSTGVPPAIPPKQRRPH